MNMTPKIKAGIIAACVLLIVLSVTIFAYSRMSGKEEQTQAHSASKDETKAKVALTKSKTGMIKTSAKVEKTLTETQALSASKSETATATKVEETPSANVTSIAPTTTTFAEVELLAPIVDSNDVETDEKDQENKEEEEEEEEGEEGEAEEIALVEPLAGSLVFGSGSAIFSFDFSSQRKTDISPMSSIDGNGDQISFSYPKPSSDGKLLALSIYSASNVSDVKRGIYVMNMDGSNLRMNIEHRFMSYDFEFGPDDDSLVYIEEDTKAIRQVFFNSEPRVNRILESVGDVGFIQCHKDYLYWILFRPNRGGFEIRRRNIRNLLAEAEVIYRESDSDLMVKYLVSPDGNSLIIARRSRLFYGNYQIIIKSIQDGSEIGPLSFEQNEGSDLYGFFISLDGKWIYASRTGNAAGLVRFRVDQIPTTGPIKLELVLPNVDFGAFPRFVPQVSEHDEDEDDN